MDAEGLGRKLLLTPPPPPKQTPGSAWKADCGYCVSISRNAHPASTFEFPSMPALRKGFWVTSGSLSPKTAASMYSSFCRNLLRAGPTTTTTIFEFISRGPIFQFWGTPGWRTKCTFYTMEHRETTKIFHPMCHQLPFWCGIRCKTFLENYGCGCVWAVPDKLRLFWCGTLSAKCTAGSRSLGISCRLGVTLDFPKPPFLRCCVMSHAKWHKVRETIFCNFLRQSAKSCDLQTMENTEANKNLQKSAKNCQQI